MNINRNKKNIIFLFITEQMKDFKYLGAIINENNLQEKEITNRITKYNENLALCIRS